MRRPLFVLSLLSVIALARSVLSAQAEEAKSPPKVLRAGIIGLTTSHVPAFTSLLNDPQATGDLADVEGRGRFHGRDRRQ